MREFKQLTYEDRIKMEALLNIKTPKQTIADELDVHISTIYREIKRGKYIHKNTDWTYTEKYSAEKAQDNIKFNSTTKGRQLKIGNDYKFVNYVEDMIINKDYSPDALLANIRNKKLEFNTKICTRTLYSYIDKGLFLNVTNKNLPFKGKRKKKKHKKVKKTNRTLPGTSIEERPEYINNRSEFGHWEMDSVIGKREKGNTMIVFTERKTNKEIVIRANDKTTLSTINIINTLENYYNKNFKKIFKSITVDNGTEFRCPMQLEQSILTNDKRTQLYYCHPYASFERGQNEKQNQMIRRKIKKGTKIEKYTDKEIEEAVEWLNEYPRKKYDYKCSEELYYEELEKIGIKKLNNFRISS